MFADRRRIHRWMLQAATLHGLVAGAVMYLAPSLMLDWAGLANGPAGQIQELGILTALFGAGYWFAFEDPLAHWPLVLTGLLVKILIPLHILSGQDETWTLSAAAILFANQIVWWAPLAWLLWEAPEARLRSKRNTSPAVQHLALRATTHLGVSLAELSALSPIMLVFLRHTGCTFCREALEDLARQRREIESFDTRIVLVHISNPRRVGSILEQKGLGDIHRVADPGRHLYRAFGLEQGSILQVFGLRTLIRGVPAAVLDRHWVGLPDADPMQMPGVFVIFHSEIISSYRHRFIADRPDYRKLASGEFVVDSVS